MPNIRKNWVLGVLVNKRKNIEQEIIEFPEGCNIRNFIRYAESRYRRFKEVYAFVNSVISQMDWAEYNHYFEDLKELEKIVNGFSPNSHPLAFDQKRLDRFFYTSMRFLEKCFTKSILMFEKTHDYIPLDVYLQAK